MVAVFRHGDRTPKQKMKMTTEDPDFLNFIGPKCKEVKLKKPKELLKVLNIAQEKIRLMLSNTTQEADVEHERVQLEKLVQIKYVLEKDKLEGLNRKIQLKPLKTEEYTNEKGQKVRRTTEALFILKFGGELTHAGVNQATDFGKIFRSKMYVEDNDKGLLRLHSTYRHDLKCFTSDEGRC